MAAPGTGQERLDSTVRLIAKTMGVEVCSCYVVRPGEVLELFATEGLRADAVHATRLRTGEGLVGVIAASSEPLALEDAWTHPQFAYRPETGEDPFHGFLGVPIIRAGRVIGVLCVQSTEERTFDDEATETLRTVAMVLAEILVQDDVLRPTEPLLADGNALLPLRLGGLGVNGGIGVGQAVLHRRPVLHGKLVADDPEHEQARLNAALDALTQSIDALLVDHTVPTSAHHEILETYRMFAQDRGWLRKIQVHIDAGLTAEAAVQQVHDDTKARMAHVVNPYMQERLADLQDLTDRLQRHLAGESGDDDLPEQAILVARALGPAELLEHAPGQIVGVVLEEGSATSHAAILARALDIPMVVRVPGALSRIDPGDPLVVDGDAAEVFVRPGEDVQASIEEALRHRDERRRRFDGLRDEPAATKDGTPVTLLMNAGLQMDLHALERTGAEGVGLFRTELPFMSLGHLPNVHDQEQLYREVLDLAAGRPVVFRTLDVGGDKLLADWQGLHEENPAMGWRSVRITLDRPAIMRQQLRALMRASAGQALRVMVPMVASLHELDACLALLRQECDRAAKRGEPLPVPLLVGVMIEVPALVFELDGLLRRVDFVSVGTNDLLQFMFASDRGNPRMTDRYDPLSLGVLRMLRQIREACTAHGKPVTICGEMAGCPLEALALLGLGYTRLSMPPRAVGPVKAAVRSASLSDLRAYVESLLAMDRPSVRSMLRQFALDHGIEVE